MKVINLNPAIQAVKRFAIDAGNNISGAARTAGRVIADNKVPIIAGGTGIVAGGATGIAVGHYTKPDHCGKSVDCKG